MDKQQTHHKKELKNASRKLGTAMVILSQTQQDNKGKTMSSLKKVTNMLSKASQGSNSARNALTLEGKNTLDKAKEKVAYKVEELQRFQDESPSFAESAPIDAESHAYTKANEKLSQVTSVLSPKEKQEKRKISS